MRDGLVVVVHNDELALLVLVVEHFPKESIRCYNTLIQSVKMKRLLEQ